MWYQNVDAYILGLRFVRSKFDHYVYSKWVADHFIRIILYVDGMLLIGNNKYMKDIDAGNFILGMEIGIDNANMKICWEGNTEIETILKIFNMHRSKSVKVAIPIGENLYVYQFPKTHEDDAVFSWVHMPMQLEFLFLQWYVQYVTLLMQWEFWANIFQNQGKSFRQV